MNNKSIDFTPGMRFGVGVDNFTEAPRGDALIFDGVEYGAGGNTSGQVVDASLDLCESQESLMKSMNLSVSASANYGLAKVSAKFQMAESEAVNDASLTVVLRAGIINPAQHMVNPRLSPAADAVFRSDPEKFRRLFGDTYIDEIHSGGEFFGIITIHTVDSSQRESMGAKMKASFSGLGVGASIQAQLDTAKETTSTAKYITLRAYMSGGSGLHNPETIEQLYDLYTQFNQSVFDHGVPVQAVIKDFEYLPLPSGPTWVNQMVRRDIVDACGRYVIQGIQLRSQLEYILNNLEEYISPDKVKLEAALDDVNRSLPLWGERADACVNDVAHCNLSGVGPVHVELPERIRTSDPLGSLWQRLKDHGTDWEKHTFQDSFLIDAEGTPIKIANYTDGERGGQYVLFRDPSHPYHEAGWDPNTPQAIAGLFWHPDTGAHAVYGDIFQQYWRQRLCDGDLGYPKSDEVDVPIQYGMDSGDRVNYFENGLLWWDHQTRHIRGAFPSEVMDHMREISQQVRMKVPLGMKFR